jgi:hypothetical protein
MSCHGTHVVVIEIPEGSWGVGGQTIDTEKISKSAHLLSTLDFRLDYRKRGVCLRQQ